MAHAEEPTNPATGELEDYDVGFPPEEHHIAEREFPMRLAMSVLGFGALFAGFLQVPGVTEVVTHFLEGTFEDSTIEHSVEVSEKAAYIGLFIGGVISIIGIGDRLLPLHAERRDDARPRQAVPPRPRLPRPQVVLRRGHRPADRPAGARDRAASPTTSSRRSSFRESSACATGGVGGLSATVRGAQSGFVRFYALLVIAGLAGLGAYFLIVSG